ncbi:MAG: winged helix-turn-helix domain-containing protein [Halobacterium sp.]
MTDAGRQGAAGPTDVFDAIADETRMRILVVLAEARREEWPDGLQYSDLQDRAGVADSGRFNYHLQQLRPESVVKSDGEYHLSLTGLRVYQLLVAGHVQGETTDSNERTVDVEAACPRCGERLEATYSDWFTLVVSCPGSSMRTVPTELLPRCYDSHGAAAPRAADLLRRQRMSLFAAGVCPFCAGAASVGVVRPGSPRMEVIDGDLEVAYGFDCLECGWFDAATVGGVAYTKPAVVGFFAEHGRSIYDYRTWELAWACTDEHTTVGENEAGEWRADVAVRLDGEELVVTSDGDATVRETRREQVGD